MSPSPGPKMAINKKMMLTFSVGITLGFVMTYMLVSTLRPGAPSPTSMMGNSQQFIPKSPHSTGETDSFVGPDKEQSWNDFQAENHHDEDQVAVDLSERVRVLCWVMTSPSNLLSKARHVKATWGRRCNRLLFMSSKDDASLPAVGLDVPEGRDYLWGKTKQAFSYIHEHHLADADWFMKADDDTYVVVENLRKLLVDHKPEEPLYLGRRFKPYVQQGYMSGGAGYVLSREAVKRFVKEGLSDPRKCRSDYGGAEDLEMGNCLQKVGVRIVDSRDALGRETFHPFIPEHHLIPGLVPRDNWYWQYNYYPAKEGPDCCSDYAVTFHYVPPNMMYVFEYFIYHLKPFGIGSKVVLPAEKYKEHVNTPVKGGQPAASQGQTQLNPSTALQRAANEVLADSAGSNKQDEKAAAHSNMAAAAAAPGASLKAAQRVRVESRNRVKLVPRYT